MENPNTGIQISEQTLIAFLAGQTARHERSCASLDSLVATMAMVATEALKLEAARQAAPVKESQAELIRAQAELLTAEAHKAEAAARLLEAQAQAQAQAPAAQAQAPAAQARDEMAQDEAEAEFDARHAAAWRKGSESPTW